MKTDIDFYEVLGVRPDAEPEVISAAYRALAKKYHPDTFKGDANEAKARMSALNSAYDVLSKPDSRRDYDRRRREKEAQPPQAQQPRSNPKTTAAQTASSTRKEQPTSSQTYERRIVEPEPEGLFAANKFFFLGFGIVAIIIVYAMK